MPSTEQQIASLRARQMLECGEEFDFRMAACESPIERLFFATALVSRDRDWRFPDYDGFRAVCEVFDAICADPGCGTGLVVSFPCAELVLVPQLVLPKLRVRIDFALVSLWKKTPRARIAIELDGHDFHERTKDQASHDRRKDRALTKAGWRVVRFTGRDVYRDVGACWDEVDDILAATEDR